MNIHLFGKKKPRVCLLGWWEGKNEGDCYMLEILQKTFADSFSTSPRRIPFKFTWLKRIYLNSFDFLIVGGGGLFIKTPPKPFDTFDKWGHSVKPGLSFFGVSIEGLSPEYEAVTKMLIEKSRFFIVRDTRSFELLRKLSPKVELAPDITFLYPRRVRRDPSPRLIGVNLRKTDTCNASLWAASINSLGGRKVLIPMSDLEDCRDIDAMSGVEGEPLPSFDISVYSRLEFMVSMRLHSIIFAVQNAIPVIGIAYAPKVRNFFHDLGLKEFCLEPDEYARLPEKFRELSSRRDEITARLQRYTEEASKEVAARIEWIKKEITGKTS